MLLVFLNRRIKDFTGSIFFQIAIAFLAVMMWMMPGNLPWIFASFYIAFSLLPLFSSDGRAYMPLLFFVAITLSSSASFLNIPVYLYAIGGTTLGSLLLFLAIKRMPLKRGELSFPFTMLLLSFLISYLIHMVKVGEADSTGIFYIIALFVVVLSYVLFNTCLKREDTILYFARTASILAISIAVEILLNQLRNGFAIGDPNFNLGWAYTSQTASTILCLSLPFFGMLVARKKFLWGIWAAFVVYGIIVLSADSGLIVLALSIIPIVFLSFRSYGKAYPYIVISILAILGLILVLLVVLNESFRERVIMALASLNLAGHRNPERLALFEKGLDAFLTFPAFGASISYLTNPETGTIVLCSNTVISTLAMGGIVGLAFWLVYEFRLYFTVLRKKAKEKWHFLLFLLILEVIGLMDNTIYNLFTLLFMFLAYSCYQITDRPDDFVVHDDFYEDYRFDGTLSYENY